MPFQIFAANPDKAWCEKFYLLYSCVWPCLFVGWAMSGLHLQAGDIGNNLVCLAIGVPFVLVPILYAPRDASKAFYEYYWVKLNVWTGIFAFAASYVYSDYFFDILGMIYDFPHLQWNLNAILIGNTKQKVPLMMYTCCWFYFLTYHVVGNLIIRVLTTPFSFIKAPLFSFINQMLATVIAAWLCAYGELWGTTMDVLHDQFHYKSMEWALQWGAWYYCLYFIVSFPMVFPMDEYQTGKNRKNQQWTMGYTVVNALATSMLVFYLLDLFAQFVVTDWKGVNA